MWCLRIRCAQERGRPALTADSTAEIPEPYATVDQSSTWRITVWGEAVQKSCRVCPRKETGNADLVHPWWGPSLGTPALPPSLPNYVQTLSTPRPQRRGVDFSSDVQHLPSSSTLCPPVKAGNCYMIYDQTVIGISTEFTSVIYCSPRSIIIFKNTQPNRTKNKINFVSIE